MAMNRVPRSIAARRACTSWGAARLRRTARRVGQAARRQSPASHSSSGTRVSGGAPRSALPSTYSLTLTQHWEDVTPQQGRAPPPPRRGPVGGPEGAGGGWGRPAGCAAAQPTRHYNQYRAAGAAAVGVDAVQKKRGKRCRHPRRPLRAPLTCAPPGGSTAHVR